MHFTGPTKPAPYKNSCEAVDKVLLSFLHKKSHTIMTKYQNLSKTSISMLGYELIEQPS